MVKSLVPEYPSKPVAWKLMGPSRFRRAIEAVKDKLSIGRATANCHPSIVSVLDIAIIRATKHDDYPAEESDIKAIFNLTSRSNQNVRSCVRTITKRLRKTNTWTVALKSLMLVHRLLDDGDVAFEKQFFYTPRYGNCLFDMSNFLDKKRLYSWDYSGFVRAYALYLNNLLELRVLARKGKNGTSRDTPKGRVKLGATILRDAPVQEMKIEQIFTRIYCLMKTLDLFLRCRPTGNAKTDRVVLVALYPVIKESFVLYNDITETMAVMIRRFIELDIPKSTKVHEILCKVSKQFDELEEFYKWSISCGVSRREYPQVVNIPQVKLDMMEKYIQKRQAEEQNMNSTKALPPMIEMKIHEVNDLINLDHNDSRLEEREIDMKIHEVGDLINFDADDSPTEEHPDKLALTLFDGSSATEPSRWETFGDLVDWETELECSANSLSNKNETPTGGFDTLVPIDSSIGVPTILALPAPPSQSETVYTDMDYANFTAIKTPLPYVQMAEMEMKQRLPTEQHVMWQKCTSNVMQGPVAYAVIQPQPYMYYQGVYTKTH